MDIVQAFYNDRDEIKFLRSCAEFGVVYTIVQDSPTLRIYRVRQIADVYYFVEKKEASVIYF